MWEGNTSYLVNLMKQVHKPLCWGSKELRAALSTASYSVRWFRVRKTWFLWFVQRNRFAMKPSLQITVSILFPIGLVEGVSPRVPTKEVDHRGRLTNSLKPEGVNKIEEESNLPCEAWARKGVVASGDSTRKWAPRLPRTNIGIPYTVRQATKVNKQ